MRRIPTVLPALPTRLPWTLLARGPGDRRRPIGAVATAAYAAGGALLVWSAAVHYHLWSAANGYGTIPTIGPLFLFQSVAGLVVGVGVIAVRRVWAALLGVAFALATAGAFVLSVDHGLFGFVDTWQAPFATEAFAVEIAAAFVLSVAVALCLVRGAGPLSADRRRDRPRARARRSD